MVSCGCSESVLKEKSLRFPSTKYRENVSVVESLHIHQNIQTRGEVQNQSVAKSIVNKEAVDDAEVLKEDTLVK